MDVGQSIRLAVDSGKVELGSKKAIKFSLVGGVKLVIASRNCPDAKNLKENCTHSKTPFVEFEGNGVELGAVCGKPFSVSVLSVVEEGNSDILKLAGGSGVSVSASSSASKKKK